MTSLPDLPHVLTTAEVAAVFRSDPKSVYRWAVTGRLEANLTPTKQRRYPLDAVRAALRSEDGQPVAGADVLIGAALTRIAVSRLAATRLRRTVGALRSTRTIH